MESTNDIQVIRGSASAYERFIRSVIWTDMQNEMMVWEAMVQSEYAGAKNMEDVSRIQGRIEAIQHLRDLPRTILNGLNSDDEATDINYSKEK